jgi:hypothetical protein
MGVLNVTRKQIPHSHPGGTANNVTTIQQLNKSLAFRELFLTLNCAPTLTGANNTVANTARGDEWGVVKRLRIIANSSDVLLDLTADQLWWLDRWYYGIRPAITVTLGDGATANPAISSTLVVPFWALRGGKPLDSVFDSGGTTDFRMEVTWGTFTDINTAATAWTTAPTLFVSSMENELTPDFYPSLVKRTVSQQLIAAGASTQFRFNLDVGPLYRGFLINATTNAAPPVDTAALFSNVRLISGSTIFFDLDEPTLQQAFTLRESVPFAIEKVTGTGLAFYPTPRINTNSNERAWYNINLVTDGYLSECINTARFNEFFLEFNVTGACQLNVISHQFLVNPRSPAVQAAAQMAANG